MSGDRRCVRTSASACRADAREQLRLAHPGREAPLVVIRRNGTPRLGQRRLVQRTGARPGGWPGPWKGMNFVLIPMYAEMSRRPPPSRLFLNLLCFPCTCLCAVSCERLWACPLLLSAYFLTPATGAVKPASHSHSARGPCRSAVGCLHLDPCPWSAPMQVAGAMRHPLSSSHALQHAGTPAGTVALSDRPTRAGPLARTEAREQAFGCPVCRSSPGV